jgi:hypothetical protein
MSEEGGNTNENTNLSSDEVSTPTPTDQKAVTEPELIPEPESEILAPLTEGGVGEGIVEAITEEAIKGQGQGEPLKMSTDEQPQLELETKTKRKKPTTKTPLMKILSSLADASKQIGKQTTQINEINQNLQSLQKQMRAKERQAGIINQISFQVNQIQKQISQVYKIQKRSTSKLQSGK